MCANEHLIKMDIALYKILCIITHYGLHLPVEVPVYDGLRQVVQVVHAICHIHGYHHLGLQVYCPGNIYITDMTKWVILCK